MPDGGSKRPHGGGAVSKRKTKARYLSGGAASTACLPHGSCGVLVSADQGRERVVGHRVLELLQEARQVEEQCPTEAKPFSAEALNAELRALQEGHAQRFAPATAGVKGLLYLRAQQDGDQPPGVVEICVRVLTAARDGASARARFAQRLLPCEAVCYASVAEILKAVQPLVAKHFAVDAKTSKTFAVVFESRSCDGLKLDRAELINAVAALVPKPHKVDLKAPDRVIMVQVVKSAAALSVLPDYYALKKYNLSMLTQHKEPDAALATAAL